jgi:hypothetical protein
MKKLICNGCSFMAGDEIAWEQYCKTLSIEVMEYTIAAFTEPKLFTDYMKYRANYNLPIEVARRLGTDRIDISSDGNSNDMIAVNTINYILSLPKEERKNHHVLVGWTHYTRRMKFDKRNSCFTNLNIHHLQYPTPNIETFKKFIVTSILEAENEDHYINYIKNLMLLENFLIANNITYTFYRALGSKKDNAISPHVFQPTWTGSFRDKEISNADCWIKFNEDETYPHLGSSWTQEMLNDDDSLFVSLTNKHPSLKAINYLADIIAESIKSQGGL